MEKLLGVFCLFLLASVALNAQQPVFNQTPTEKETPVHRCDFDKRMEEVYELYPDLKDAMDKEAQAMINSGAMTEKNADCTTVHTLPVVFHFLYDPTNLNDGYRNDNYVINNILGGMNNYFRQDDSVDDNYPPAFQNTATNGTCLDFCLAQYDHPQNDNLHGDDLNRDGIKDADGDGIIDEGQYAINRYNITSAQGSQIQNAGPGQAQQNIILGIAPAWPVNEYINIYIVPDLAVPVNGAVTAGYTYLPGINGDGFNSIYMGYSFANSGTTLSHEVGHWLGLQHVWGSGGCNSEDYYLGNTSFPVNDTYPQNTQTSFSQSCNVTTDAQLPMSCNSVDNIFNIMDYGPCLEYFTKDQGAYMFNTVTNLGASGRNNFSNSLDQVKCQSPNPPIAAFTPTSGTITVCQGESVSFTDASSNNPIDWDWTFTGSALNSTFTSTLENPTILPDQSGTIIVNLTVGNSQGSDSAGPSTVTINVLPNGATGCPPINNECYGAIDLSSAFPACPATFSSFGPYSTVGATSTASDVSLMA